MPPVFIGIISAVGSAEEVRKKEEHIRGAFKKIGSTSLKQSFTVTGKLWCNATKFKANGDTT